MFNDERTRRETMKNLLAGGLTASALGGYATGVASAKKKECPSGTTLLAKYNAEGCEFTFEKGEDVVSFSNLTCSENEIEGFSWETEDGGDDDSAAETVTVYSVKYGPQTDEFEPSFEPGVDKRSGSVDLTDERNAISNVVFCQGTYAQVDFFRGELIEDLCEERYGSRALEFFDWGSYEGVLPGQGQDASPFDIDGDAYTVSISYDPDDFDKQVGLAVYLVPDPDFDSDSGNISFRETRCRQVLYDVELDSAPDKGELTASLPSP